MAWWKRDRNQAVSEQPEEGPEQRPAGLRERYFLAANAVYRYCYFVGIQLLRSTRGYRRHLVRLLERMGAELGRWFSRKKRAARQALGELRHSFLSPIQEVRDHWRLFSQQLQNAQRFGTGDTPARVVLRMVRLVFSAAGRMIGLLLSYLAPLAALMVLVAAVDYFSGLELALHVEYNGSNVGYIASEAVFDQAEQDMRDRMMLDDVLVADPTQEDVDQILEQAQQEQELQRQARIAPRFELAVVDREDGSLSNRAFNHLAGLVGIRVVSQDQLYTADELTNELIRAVAQSSAHPDGFAVEEASGLYIDEVYIGAVSDGQALLDALYRMKERYRTDEYPDADIQFIKKVELKAGLFPSDSIRSLGSILEILNKQERGERRYTVVEGDTPLTIAAKNGIALAELVQLNPDVETSLFPGDELLISQSVPYMGVQVRITVTEEEQIDYDITQQVNPDQNVGYTRVLQEGREGLQNVTYEVILVDGLETERNILNTERIQDPVTEIIEVGGNRPLEVIPQNSGAPVTSGAFAWPTSGSNTAGSPGWMGYYGHTGQDIAWSGCYGAPVYASASGTVVASGWGGWYGYRVIINHGGGYQTLYAHCSQLYVSVGQTVEQGQTIGAIGRTGNTTGPHLHFEVRINGTPVNPTPYLYG